MKKEINNEVLKIKTRLTKEFYISEEIADVLIRDYGLDVIKVIISKPYILCHYDIELEAVKEIIEKNSNGKNENYKKRYFVAATIIHIIEHLIDLEGHTFIYKSELEGEITRLGVVVDGGVLEKTLKFLETESEIVRESNFEKNECIYLKRMYKAETELAKLINYFAESNKYSSSNKDKVNEFIEKFNSTDIKLNKLQQKAVSMAIYNNISIITGCAGSGKTTIIRAIVEGYKTILREINPKIQLVSFTGKAVERMSSVTGIHGSTIHRLLGLGTDGRRVVHSINTDVLIIDEAGIIGLELFEMLLESLKGNKNIRIVIVGDEFQLPSIKPGNVLKELLKSKIIPAVCLKEVVRQSKDSLIINNANKITKGIGIDETRSGVWLKKNEFEFVEADSKSIKSKVLSTIEKLLSKGESIYDIQVMSPFRKGINGVEELNMEIAERFNCVTEREIYKFGVLDPVIAVSNDYEKCVFNGKKGIIKSLEAVTDLNRIESITVNFSDKEATFKKNEIEELDLTYVSTVHKMQGSESKIVIMIIDKEHENMLNRELLYVGVTRAVQKVILVGDKEIFNVGVKRVSKQRHSLLTERIIENIVSIRK